jgi:hypothetical protein
MVVGPKVARKFTWLLDEVEVKGIVRDIGSDDIGLEPDDNYKHLISLLPGNNPLHWHPRGFPGCIHCETYPEIETNERGGINKEPFPPWLKRDGTPLYKKGADPADPHNRNKDTPEPFTIKGVIDPNTGKPRELKLDDHIRVVGRWVLDHHPEYCDGYPKVVPCDQPHDYTSTGGGAPRKTICWRYNFRSGFRCRERGLLRVGFPHAELHPFRWDEITLVNDKKPNDVETEILSLAAPLYEEVYVGGGKWAANALAGVASPAPELTGHLPWTSVFITEVGSNFHNSVNANMYLKAPPLPQGFTPHSSLIGHHEQILKNGTGSDVSQIRTLTVMDDGVKVTATITAPILKKFDGINVGNIQDPANDKSIFQAQYNIRWLPRLVALDNDGKPVERILMSPTPVGSTSKFVVLIQNRGPDILTINKIHQGNNSSSPFKIDNPHPIPTNLGFGHALDMVIDFSPLAPGNLGGILFVDSNDPAQWRLQIPLQGQALPPVSASGYKDGTLLREQNDPKVYVIYGGAKFWIPSPPVLLSLGFSWNNVNVVSDGSLAEVPNIPRDGFLLKEQNNPKVYFMQGGKRRHITSAESFNAYHFSWDNIRTVPDGSLSTIPEGESLPYPPPRTLQGL